MNFSNSMTQMFIYNFTHEMICDSSQCAMMRIEQVMQDFDIGYVSPTTTTTKNRTGTFFLAGIGMIILVAILFAHDFLSIFALACLFAAANAGLRAYKAYIDFPLEAELTTFATVLMTMGFGLQAGLFTAIWVGFWGDVFTGLTVYTPFTIAAYVLAAFLSTLFPSSMFLVAGVIISFALTAISYVLYHFLESFSPFENAMYSFTNLASNLYFFVALGFVAKLIIG